MNIILQPIQFNPIYLYFLERKSNMIIDGFFSKLMYSTNHFTTTGLFIDCLFQPQSIKKTGISIINIDIQKNNEPINRLIDIEKQILLAYIYHFQIANKTPVYDIDNKMQLGNIKFYSSAIYNKSNTYKVSSNMNYYIKISGIWETDYQIGLTYKIIEYQ